MDAQKRCDTLHDYDMHVYPLEKDKPIHYTFTKCPIAEFAKEHDLLEVMPAMCNPDYPTLEYMNVKLIRKCTCSNSDYCDYYICGSEDHCVKEQLEYVDEMDIEEINNDAKNNLV